MAILIASGRKVTELHLQENTTKVHKVPCRNESLSNSFCAILSVLSGFDPELLSLP